MVKATKITKPKIKKNTLQKQKQKQTQGQNVIVNVNAPVKPTRKRITKPKPPNIQIPPKSSLFQAPTYMTPVASLNPKPDNNASILSDILKHINKPNPEPNQLEKAKVKLEEDVVPLPSMPPSFGIPAEKVSLVAEVKNDPMGNKNTFIRPQVYEAKQEALKFKAPPIAEPKPPSLVQTINIGQEKKYEAPTKQPNAELETGGTFGALGVNDAQKKAHLEAGKQITEPLMQELTEEARPTQEEIDMGIVPPIAGEMVQDEQPIIELLKEPEKQLALIPEKIATKASTEQIQLKALTMGEEKPFTKSFLYSTPLPPLKTIKFTKDEINLMRGSRVKALEKPLLLKQDAEPVLSIETNLPLSPEKEVRYEPDEEAKKLAGLSNMELAKILEDNGITVKYNTKNGKYFPALNKTLLKEAIQKLS